MLEPPTPTLAQWLVEQAAQHGSEAKFVVGFDPELHSQTEVEQLEADLADATALTLLPLPKPNLLDELWQGRPPLDLPPLRVHAAAGQGVAEKLQHDPHIPWFFTGVTAPSALQSKFRGMFSVGRCGRTRDDSCRLRRSTRAASIGSRMRSDDANSSSVRSANGVAPYSAPSRADISFARAMFSANISRRFAYSFASEAYVFPCSSTNASKSRSCRVIRRRDARGDVDARSSRPTEKDDRRAPRA